MIHETHLNFEALYIPISVAFDAHFVTAIRQDHFGAGLQANPTLLFSLQLSSAKTTISFSYLRIAKTTVSFSYLFSRTFHARMLFLNFI